MICDYGFEIAAPRVITKTFFFFFPIAATSNIVLCDHLKSRVLGVVFWCPEVETFR